ncbi:hypothetical protein [Pseudomonas sp. OTU2001]|uniref:hypothetical protein n=1 Tax=Pseudomonas sp. OTU2001 TaxID=3043859 RepID=UPI00313DA827
MSVNRAPRKIHIVDLSYVGQEHEILHPERLALSLSNRVSALDIGVFVYSVREKIRGAGYWVDESSLISSRRKMLVAWLDKMWSSGTKGNSIETDVKNFEYAINWCDGYDHRDVMCTPEGAQRAYMAFTSYLYQEIASGQAKPLSCQARQTILRRVLALQFPEDYGYIIASAPPIKNRREGLEPPGEDDVKQYIDITLNIALSISRFLVGFQAFPLRFDTNEYHTYFFPGTGKFITPLTEGEHGYSAYDYREGRLLTIEELRIAKPEARLADLRETLKRAQRVIDDANADSHHQFRVRLAGLAMKAYACLINLVVGANSGEVIQFLYEDALEVVRSPLKKELSAVKLRAKGLVVNYSIGRGPGMKLLREYLEFRSWILNGRSSELLFFHVVDGRGLPSTDFPSLENNFSTKFYNKLQGVFVSDSSKNIPPRLVRKFKSLTLHHLRHSPMLVSAVLNHTERTNAQFYSGVTDKQQKEEFGGFWASMLEAAKRFSSESKVGGIPIAAGHCDGLNDPVAEIPVVPIEPDCNSQYGCLYCIHYLVHSDETDIHKLMSFKYVVEAIRENAPNFEFSEEILKGVIVRISFILEGISKRSKSAADLVDVMNKKVFELGILTPFWERRLQRYEKMGVYI